MVGMARSDFTSEEYRDSLTDGPAALATDIPSKYHAP